MPALALQEEQVLTDESARVTMRAARDILQGRPRVVAGEPWVDPDPAATRWRHAVKDLLWPARAAGVPVRAIEEQDTTVGERRVFRLLLDVGGQRVAIQMEAP